MRPKYLAKAQMRCPLPFFLEYPLRRLVRADDQLDKIIRAGQLLTIVLKSAVLLPLEEALEDTACPEAVQGLARELGGKPLSDGSWLELLRRLRKAVADAAPNLQLFGQLLADSGGEVESVLKDLVQARNGFHHRNNDAKAMIEAFGCHLPMLESFLRSRLSGVAFIVPQTLQLVKGVRSVRGLELSGFETEFHAKDFAVKAPLESFPSGKIIAMDTWGSKVINLSRFFISKAVKASTIDVGIFDRSDGSEPCFEYVRGLGGDPGMAAPQEPE